MIFTPTSIGNVDLQEILLYFESGTIQAVSSNLDDLHLGDFIVKERLLDSALLTRFIQRQRKRKQKLGRMLLQKRLVSADRLGGEVGCRVSVAGMGVGKVGVDVSVGVII